MEVLSVPSVLRGRCPGPEVREDPPAQPEWAEPRALVDPVEQPAPGEWEVVPGRREMEEWEVREGRG